MTPASRLIGRGLVLALALAAGAQMAGCAHIKNAFKSDHVKYKGTGTRIPILAFDQTLKVSDALKGQDFYLPPPQPIGDWTQPGGPADQQPENVDAGKDFTVAWRSGIGAGSARTTYVTAPPVTGGGRIYTLDGAAHVSAFDPANGRLIWRVDLAQHSHHDKEGFGGGVAYADGRVFVSSGYRFVDAVDAATGKILWRTDTEAPVHGAPVVSDGRVFAESVDDDLMTFDAQTGVAGWAYQALNEPARILAAGSPAVTSDTVVSAYGSGEMIALQPANGNGLWSLVLSKTNRNSALSEIRDISGRPVVYHGDVYAVSHSGVFSSVDIHTGNQHWQIPVTSVSSPWPAGDVVYVTDTSGEVVCASRDSGAVYWITDMNKDAKKKKDRGVWSGPIMANNHIVVVATNGVAAELDPKTGAIQHTLKLGSPALQNPIAANGDLYVVTQAGELIAIR